MHLSFGQDGVFGFEEVDKGRRSGALLATLCTHIKAHPRPFSGVGTLKPARRRDAWLAGQQGEAIDVRRTPSVAGVRVRLHTRRTWLVRRLACPRAGHAVLLRKSTYIASPNMYVVHDMSRRCPIIAHPLSSIAYPCPVARQRQPLIMPSPRPLVLPRPSRPRRSASHARVLHVRRAPHTLHRSRRPLPGQKKKSQKGPAAFCRVWWACR